MFLRGSGVVLVSDLGWTRIRGTTESSLSLGINSADPVAAEAQSGSDIFGGKRHWIPRNIHVLT